METGLSKNIVEILDEKKLIFIIILQFRKLGI